MKKHTYLSFLEGVVTYRIGLIIFNLVIQIILFSYNSIPAIYIRKVLNKIETTANPTDIVLSDITVWLFAIVGFAFLRVIFIFVDGISSYTQTHLNESLLKLNLFRLIENVPNLKKVAGNSSKIFDTIKHDTRNSISPISEAMEVIGYTAYSTIAIITLFTINYKVTLFIFLPLSIVVFVLGMVTDRIKNYRKQNREIGEKISESISDMTDSVLTIKVNNAQESVVEHFDRLQRKRFEVVIKDIIFNETVKAFANSTIYIGTAIMMILVANAMLKGQFLVGDFSVYIYYLGTLASLVNRIIDLVALTKQGEVSYLRMVDIIGEDNANDMNKHVPVYIQKKVPKYRYPKMERTKLKEFKVQGLSYQYDTNGIGLSDINFSVKEGEILAITGNVGSGKTTLLNVMLGILPENEGFIYWNSNVIKQRSEFMKPPNVAYIAQSIGLFHGTIRENITFGKSVTNEQIEEALMLAVFKMDVDEMKNGLKTEIGNHGDMLSGGQKQRLALTRMFLNDAELYMMDDCSSALDIKTEQELWMNIRKHMKRKGSACIVASNKEYVLQQADKIVVLEGGKVLKKSVI